MTIGRKAFTLIELLVVIAIIAILAAILFPVFAAAKDSAKKTQSLSNIKQLCTSTIMYSGDYDDTAVLAGSYVTWDTWAMEVQPYTKTWNIFWSPAGGNRYTTAVGANNDNAYWWESFAQYGYNITYMNRAEGDCSNFAHYTPLNIFAGPPVMLTSVVDAAATVLLAEAGQDAPNDNVGTSFVYSPGAQTDPQSCAFWPNDWGLRTGLSYYGFSGNADKTRMGFFRPRHAGSGVVAFVDGHAKLMKPGALAAGTDWNYNTSTPGNVYIVDRTKYIWDIY